MDPAESLVEPQAEVKGRGVGTVNAEPLGKSDNLPSRFSTWLRAFGPHHRTSHNETVYQYLQLGWFSRLTVELCSAIGSGVSDANTAVVHEWLYFDNKFMRTLKS